MHMFSVEHGFYGGHGIVGAQVPLGTGPRLRAQVPRGWRRLPCLFRRRRGQPGPGLRELQHGRAVEAADHLRDREQPVRHGHQRQALVGRDPALPPRRELPHSRHAGRRHGRARGARRGRGRARMGARRQGPDPAWSSRPIAIAATRCPTRPSTASREEVQDDARASRSDRARAKPNCSKRWA